MNIRAHTYIGGADLYYGCPDLTGAVVLDTKYNVDPDDYETVLRLQDKHGKFHTITIVQER